MTATKMLIHCGGKPSPPRWMGVYENIGLTDRWNVRRELKGHSEDHAYEQ